jgi:hypothetical protein
MRAVVVSTGHCPAMQGLAGQEPLGLLPIAGRPFLHFIVECLVDSGVSEVDCILSEMPERVENSLGDGTRWGIQIRYHLVRDPARPYGRLAVLGITQGEPVVLAHADRLPLWKFDASKPSPELVFANGEWTGWGLLPGSVLCNLIGDLDEAGLSAELSGRLNARSNTPIVLSVRTFEEFLEANWAVLEKRFPNLMLGGREAGDGIWISRNVSLHPTARLTAPVYLGENSRISAGVQLGPRVVIANNCLVGQSSMLSDTVVFGGSYIGESLELTNAIVDRNRLVNVSVGAAITIADNFILGSFVERQLRHFARRAASRIVAGLLSILTSPLLLLSWLWCVLTRSGPAICRKTVVRLPAAADQFEDGTYNLISFCASTGVHIHSGGAHEFFQHFLPGLINIARGHLAMVGVAPRSAEEINALPRDWKQLCLGSVAGLITEAYVIHGAAPAEDLLYSAEVFYVATAGAKHDTALIAGYFMRLLGVKRRAEPIDAPASLEDNRTP